MKRTFPTLRIRPAANGLAPSWPVVAMLLVAALGLATLALDAQTPTPNTQTPGKPSNTTPPPGNHGGKPSVPYEKPDGLVEPFRPEPEPEKPTNPNPSPSPNPIPIPNPNPVPTPSPAPVPVPRLPTPAVPSNQATATPSPVPTPGTTVVPGAITARRRTRNESETLERWQVWWRYNRDAFIVRYKYRPTPAPTSKEAELFVGRVKHADGNTVRAPHFNRLRDQILPVLEKALKARSPSIRASACVAIGKSGRAAHVPLLAGMVSDSAYSVRQSAVLGLGLLQQESARPALLGILRADKEGVRVRGGRKPENRLRALAALSLGLIGSDPDGKTVAALTRVSSHRSANLEMAVMATIGLGALKGDLKKTGPAAWQLKNLAQNRKRYSHFIRAQAVTGIGRMVQLNDWNADTKTLGGLARLLTAARTVHVRRSAAGALAAAVKTPAERTAAAKLLTRWRERAGDSHTRNLCAVALGRVGGEAAYRELCTALRKSGRTNHRIYCALGLAILLRDLPRDGKTKGALDPLPGLRCLRAAFAREKSLSNRAGLAIALGIARDRDAGNSVLKALRRSTEPVFRGHLSLALGMMRYEPAVKDLTYLITETKYRPEVKEQIAIGLGIIGVKNLMPILTWMQKSRASYDLEAVTRALGTVGDRSVVKPIAEMALDARSTIFTRAAACQALGILGDPRPMPTLSIIREDHNYLGCTTTVNEILARGF